MDLKQTILWKHIDCAPKHLLNLTSKCIETTVVSLNTSPDLELISLWNVNVVERQAPLLLSGSAVNTHISPKDSRSLQRKVTSAALLEAHSSGTSFPLICSSYQEVSSDLIFNMCLKLMHLCPGNQASMIRIAPKTELLLLCCVLNICSQLERWRPHRHRKSEQYSIGLCGISRSFICHQISKEFIYWEEKRVVRAVTTLEWRATRCIIATR